MKTKPISAFGYVAFACSAEPGETRSLETASDGSYQKGIYYYTKGLARNTVVETGQVLPDRVADWLNTEQPPGTSSDTKGTIKVEYIEPTEWICIPNEYNRSGIPTTKSLRLEVGATPLFKKGSDYLLCRGSLTIDGKKFTAPTQIRVRSGDVSPEILEESFLLLFE